MRVRSSVSDATALACGGGGQEGVGVRFLLLLSFLSNAPQPCGRQSEPLQALP